MLFKVCSPKPVPKLAICEPAQPATVVTQPITTSTTNPTVSGIANTTTVLTKPTKVPAANNRGRQENKNPQTIAVVKGKKYVMVAKPLTLPNE